MTENIINVFHKKENDAKDVENTNEDTKNTENKNFLTGKDLEVIEKEDLIGKKGAKNTEKSINANEVDKNAEKEEFLSKKDAPWLLQMLQTSSVEPVLVLSMMSSIMVQVISQSWMLRIACEEECDVRNCTREECDQNSTLQAELQKTVAQVQAWRSAVEFSLPLVLVPLLGAWSDAKPGRRLTVLLYALSGRTVQLVLCLILLALSPSLTLIALCLALPVSLTASNMAVDMAAYSHISDTSHSKVRTVRLGIANAFWCLGSVLGLLCSGFLFQYGGENLVFGVALTLQVGACAVAMWRVRSPDSTDSTHQDSPSKNVCQLFLQPLTVVTRRRAGRARLLMSLMLANVLLAYGASCGRQAIMFLYTRLRFGWDEVEFGLYGTFLMLMEVIGSFIAMTLFSHKLGLPDTVVGLMSCVSQVLSSSFYTLADSTLTMYIAPLVEIANGQVVVIPRAIVTKLTEPQEQGKVHALFGCVEAIVPLIFEPLYNSLYSSTLHVMPQAVFWLSAVLTLPPTLLFVWLQWGAGKSWISKSTTNATTQAK